MTMADVAENGSSPNPPDGMIFNIQRASTEDGPGIRTTVFFKGCSLRCAWCHNPEGIEARPQVQWVETRCIGCHACIAACPRRALSVGPTGIAIDRNLCDGCGDCTVACPTGAMALSGQRWTATALAAEAARDEVYFKLSGGGITASGGEPALQAAFVAELFRRCRARGIATALDTCGQVAPENDARILPHTDLVLFDIKIMDPERHRRHTGHDNRLILENLERIAAAKQDGWPGKIWVRTPIIPGATDDEENIIAIGRFLAARLGPDLERWQLCAFNRLCRDKYRRLGLKWAYEDAALIPADRMARLCEAAYRWGPAPGIVSTSGALGPSSGAG
jgi:pyruvate formate lyase activating enzyme